MKKICYVVTIPATIESFFIPQLKYLSDNGFDVTVVCSNSENLQEELGENIKFNPIDIPRGISFGGSISAIKSLTQFFKSEKFDLIQYSTPNAAFYSSIAAKKAGCKLRNYHLMGFKYLGVYGFGRYILKTLEKISCRLSTSIECVSNSNLELGVKEGIFPREKATVVFNGSTGGVDLDKFNFECKSLWRTDIREEYNIQNDDLVFGFVGRITRDKGINELLEAYKKLKENLNNTKLFLVGDFEAEEQLDQDLLNWSRNDNDIVYISSKTDIERYFSALDVLVLPSYREGFGNVIIEAEAMGVPVIVSNIPGPIDAMVNGKTGLTVEVKSVNSLFDSMMKMTDDNLRKNMSANAQKYAVENFDSEKLCEKILERKNLLLN